jgi:hypothetical protein
MLVQGHIAARIELVCRDATNRAGARLLLASALAKVHQPAIDIRKPYTEIPGERTYSGRTYDEHFITAFINTHNLPCNPTTAFLTPALRNRNITLTPDLELEGRPRQLYKAVLHLLTDVFEEKISAADLLAETIRCLLVYRNERQQRMSAALEGLKTTQDSMPLAAEAIVTLIQQHLLSRNASRLPVLVVAAAYQAAEKHLGERVLPMYAHNAADEQTGAVGDLEITLLDDQGVITSYEMKMKRVTREDIDRSLQKIMDTGKRPDNHIFITTEVITDEVKDYAATIYNKTGGIEVVVLDCIGFLRHYLHLFHRLRMQFVDAYQNLLLAEPDSAVRHELKEAFLALRLAAESGQ